MRGLLCFFWVICVAISNANPTFNAVIGTDDRFETFEVKNPRMLSASRATVALIKKENLAYQPGGGYKLSQKVESYQSWANLCPNVRFSKQPSASDCSGFLISEDVVITAGHCVPDKSSCENWWVVFDYQMTSPGKWNSTFWSDQVYRCRNIIKTSEDPDYAAIRLDRKVVRTPVRLRSEGKPKLGTALYTIGHPHGLPQKIAIGGEVKENTHSEDELYFEASLDVFGGSSGSPVFNVETHLVEGIFVVGFGEFDQKKHPLTGESCKVPAVRTLTEATWGWVTRAPVVDSQPNLNSVLLEAFLALGSDRFHRPHQGMGNF